MVLNLIQRYKIGTHYPITQTRKVSHVHKEGNLNSTQLLWPTNVEMNESPANENLGNEKT